MFAFVGGGLAVLVALLMALRHRARRAQAAHTSAVIEE